MPNRLVNVRVIESVRELASRMKEKKKEKKKSTITNDGKGEYVSEPRRERTSVNVTKEFLRDLRSRLNACLARIYAT